MPESKRPEWLAEQKSKEEWMATRRERVQVALEARADDAPPDWLAEVQPRKKEWSPVQDRIDAHFAGLRELSERRRRRREGIVKPFRSLIDWTAALVEARNELKAQAAAEAAEASQTEATAAVAPPAAPPPAAPPQAPPRPAIPAWAEPAAPRTPPPSVPTPKMSRALPPQPRPSAPAPPPPPAAPPAPPAPRAAPPMQPAPPTQAPPVPPPAAPPVRPAIPAAPPAASPPPAAAPPPPAPRPAAPPPMPASVPPPMPAALPPAPLEEEPLPVEVAEPTVEVAEPEVAEVADVVPMPVSKPPKERKPRVNPISAMITQAKVIQDRREQARNAERTQIMTAIRRMNDEAYETMLLDFFRRDGYLVYRVDDPGSSAADLEIHRENERTLVSIRQRGHQVGQEAVRDLDKEVATSSVNGAFLFTDSHFTEAAVRVANNSNVTLVDGTMLAELIEELTMSELRERRASARLAKAIGWGRKAS
jgi:HJR/Mrr/RecB family endonuclease